MELIDYDTFVSTVNTDDLAMLTSFVVGVQVNAITASEGDDLFAQAMRLYDAGLLANLHRIYINNAPNAVVQALTALVSPQVPNYVTRLARERLQLSRDQVPAA